MSISAIRDLAADMKRHIGEGSTAFILGAGLTELGDPSDESKARPSQITIKVGLARPDLGPTELDLSKPHLTARLNRNGLSTLEPAAGAMVSGQPSLEIEERARQLREWLARQGKARPDLTLLIAIGWIASTIAIVAGAVLLFLNMDDHRWWIWLPITIVTGLAISVLSDKARRIAVSLLETRGVLVTSNTYREMSVKRAGTWRDLKVAGASFVLGVVGSVLVFLITR